MKKKIVISLAVLLVSGTAFIANRASAEGPVESNDPNVVALSTVKKDPPCYLQSEDKSCTKTAANEMCAACDDDIIVKPEVPTTRPSED